MNESIKFINDAANGKYAKNDTGVMVAVCRDYTDSVVGVVRLSDDSYITAPLADIEYAGA
jgi:hypothetical protein